MSFDVLVILFILFSIVSSLVNRYQSRRAEEKRVDRRSPGPVEEDEEDVFDTFDWGRLEEPEPEPPKRVTPQPAEHLPAEVPGIERVLVQHEAEERIAELVDVRGASVYERSRRSRRHTLRFDRRAVLRGILYAEILGPPRAIRPAGEDWD